MNTQHPRGFGRGGAVVYVLWASHAKVQQGRWVPLLTGLRGQAATDELIARQDRVRRSGEPCRFRLLPVGTEPD